MCFKIEFTDKEITPWGGMHIMKAMIDKLKLKDVLSSLPLPSQKSNRGYSPIQLILSYWISIWCGANKYEHLEVTRQDEVLRQLFNWKRMAGHKSFQRYFSKFTQAINQSVFTNLYQWFFSNLHFDNYTLDFDSTIMTRYGEQEGAKVGYNPKKRGRKSHHPLMAFVAEARMISNFWLRPGNSYTTNNFISFLEDTIDKLSGKKVGLIRADSGFYDTKVLDYLEDREVPYNYVIAAKFYSPIKSVLASRHGWWELDDGIEMAETMYQSPLWKKPRRLIMVRQEITKRPKAAGKQLRLFEDEGYYKNFRYSCFVTNLTLPAKTVYDAYRNRADAENRIKEIKYDFGAGSFNQKDFFATEAALNFVMMAYNLMSLFRQAILRTKKKPTLKTMRYKIFSVGAYITKRGNSKILKLSLAMKRREWFKGLFASAKLMDWPFVVET